MIIEDPIDNAKKQQKSKITVNNFVELVFQIPHVDHAIKHLTKS